MARKYLENIATQLNLANALDSNDTFTTVNDIKPKKSQNANLKSQNQNLYNFIFVIRY